MSAIEAFKHAPSFRVGQRVRVDIPEIPKNERQCDTGIISGIRTRFVRTPEARQVWYVVTFDRPYIKPEYVRWQNIPTYNTTDGAEITLMGSEND